MNNSPLLGNVGIMMRVKKFFSGGSFIRNVLVLTGGTAFAQLLVVAVSPLLTRMYRPEDFGTLAVYASLLSVLAVIASLRYELAILLPDTEEDAANIMVLSLLTLVGMTALTGILVWVFGDALVQQVNAPALGPYLWLLPCSVFGVGLYQILNYWSVRKREFGRVAATKVRQSTAQVITQIACGLMAWRPLGLLLGDAIGRIGGSGTLARSVFRTDRTALKAVSGTRMKQMAVRYKRFPLLTSFSSLFNSAGLQLPPLLLVMFFGTQIGGFYALVQRVVGAPMTMVGQSVAQVFFGESARLARENPVALKKLYFKAASKLFLLGGVPIGLLALVAPWAFELIFGDEWGEAGIYIQIMALGFIAQFVVVPLSQTLNMLERQGMQLAWDIFRFVIIIGGLVLSSVLKLPAREAIVIYGVGMFVCYVVLFFLSAQAVIQHSKKGTQHE
ncbi:lipopolysaccharide biosynthesis protein [Aneurinibacillus migulanus]|uniref:lipopolysaccharide biosynthesis protein n=1 Tax=Aneurinibacillus migulanus TaxID=47500 RepID=UPI002E1B1C14|nr:lipopolysaccharide biosynthesis protein [Aneurinibacillus migulanus]